jgi:hypothetical protein
VRAMITESPTAITLAAWLESHRCYALQPVTVTIGQETYAGCSYRQDCNPPEGARSQEPYTVEAIYLLGTLPSSYRRSSNVAYTRQDDTREWYIAGCWQGEPSPKGWAWLTEERIREIHPFGFYFLLHPWEVPDGSDIDRYETKPYRRVAITVNNCSSEEN